MKLEVHQGVKELADRGDKACGCLIRSLVGNHVNGFFVNAHSGQAQVLAFEGLLIYAKALADGFGHRGSLSYIRDDLFVLLRQRLAVSRFKRPVAERGELQSNVGILADTSFASRKLRSIRSDN